MAVEHGLLVSSASGHLTCSSQSGCGSVSAIHLYFSRATNRPSLQPCDPLNQLIPEPLDVRQDDGLLGLAPVRSRRNG